MTDSRTQQFFNSHGRTADIGAMGAAARAKRLALSILLPAFFAITGAHAMMSPDEYRAARDGANHWLQFRIDAVKAPRRLPGVCIVRAEVTRVFRGAPPAAKIIDIEVECKARHQLSPPGEEFRLDIEDFRTGRHLEAFVEVRGSRYGVVARQIGFVASPGDQPTFTGKE